MGSMLARTLGVYLKEKFNVKSFEVLVKNNMTLSL
jgi:hypothetical protein